MTHATNPQTPNLPQMTLYTVFHTDHSQFARTGLTLEDAFHELMSYDGHEYEIRHEPAYDGWDLWHTPFSRNSTCGGKPMVKTVIYSIKREFGEATADIVQQVVEKGWTPMEAMTDGSYAEMLAQIERDNAE